MPTKDTTYDRILDNHFGGNVHQRLDANLRDADVFRAVSAYFSIYGYGLLEDALKSVGETRFLFGEPSSASDVDPGEREGRGFKMDKDGGLSPARQMKQKHLAQRCEEWVQSGKVEIRSAAMSNFLHGKMYLTDRGESGAGIVGSSNFTQRGLGGGGAPNIEINLTADEAALAELRDWFDRLWADKTLTKDAKQEVINALERIGMDYSPEAVYYKTLFELFRDEMDALAAPDANPEDSPAFSESQIWRKLYEFQRDGARSVIYKLNRHNGCILADSVGLGKTYTALAAIKYFESRNQRVLVLCPKKLMGNWSLYQAANGHVDNPFPDDRFGYALLAHTDLSRGGGMSGGIDLANFNWSGFDMVVIDESHNFRNDGGKRYQKLLDDVIKGGARTKVLMLSATPVNTSLLDLRNQIYLMTEKRENAFRDSLKVGDIGRIMDDAQREFLRWEGGFSRGAAARDKAALMDRLGADFLRLLYGVSISRSRRQIERFYAADLARAGSFPKRQKPRNISPPADTGGELSYDAVAAQINGLALSIYFPSDYLHAKATPRQIQTARNLIGMIRVNFLKRLESSPRSLALTLRRVIEKIDNMLKRIRRYRERSQLVPPGSPGMGLMSGPLFETRPSVDEETGADAAPDDDDDDEGYDVSQSKNSFRFAELDLERWDADMKADRDTLQTILESVEKVKPERDGKLKAVKELIREKANNPTTDGDGNKNRKTLVFTTFKDTAIYLYDNLKKTAKDLKIEMAMVSGDMTRASAGKSDFNSALSNFAPAARGRADADADIDLLIATDCISEGQNLQDCDYVINYDVHWNPVRIIQRFGRVDRIGSKSETVRMVNCWPTNDMEVYLRLEDRVRARMALADAAATGDANPLDEDAARRELQFRDDQLLRLRDEAIAIEDMDGVPTLGDLTLSQFLAQLMIYLRQDEKRLEKMPPGAYAVTNPEPAAAPGVIFCLEQRNAAQNDARTKTVSPKPPFYLVYMRADGRVSVGCANIHKTLTAFAAAAIGKTEPILALCDAFDRQTKRGKKMEFYNNLLKAAVADIGRTNDDTQIQSIGLFADPDVEIPVQSETPNAVTDFKLVTWLVIMGEDEA